MKDVKFNIMEKEIQEFLVQSNWIEREYTERAEKDAIKAWEWITTQKGDLKVSQILKIHNYLLKNIHPEIAGEFRSCDVWIGGHCKVFISESLLRDNMVQFCKEFNKVVCLKGQEGVEEKIKNNHVLFEEFHVFQDGNGRVGRLLMNLQRVRMGLPVHIIHGKGKGDYGFHHEQKEYYSWFK